MEGLRVLRLRVRSCGLGSGMYLRFMDGSNRGCACPKLGCKCDDAQDLPKELSVDPV